VGSSPTPGTNKKSKDKRQRAKDIEFMKYAN
jgi:hypothetical protein